MKDETITFLGPADPADPDDPMPTLFVEDEIVRYLGNGEWLLYEKPAEMKVVESVDGDGVVFAKAMLTQKED